jgi:hypothetical protein
MGFKEQLEKDLKNVFFNINEFAEMHNVEGEDVLVVIDKDLFKEKYKEIETEDIIILGITLFIQKEHLRGEPKVNREMTVDGKTYTIRDSSLKNNMYEIDLQKYTE